MRLSWSSYGYCYSINDKYLTLQINAVYKAYCATGGDNDYYYTYDIENDDYLTNNELLQLYNVNITDLKSKIRTDVVSNPPGDEEAIINGIINNLEQDNYQAYINISGALILEFRYSLMDTLTYTYWKN